MIAYKDITKIIDLFNANYILFTLAISVVSAILLLALSKKYLQILQQSSYRNCEFNDWLKKKPNVYNSRLVALTVLSFLGSVIVVISFAFLKSEITAYASLLVYILFVALYFLGDKKHKDKCPLSFTNRIKRLIGAYFLISLIISFALLTLINIAFYYAKDIWWLKSLRLSFVTVLPCFIPKIIKLANLIISPIEKSINKKFIKIATKKLESFPGRVIWCGGHFHWDQEPPEVTGSLTALYPSRFRIRERNDYTYTTLLNTVTGEITPLFHDF